MDAHTFLAVNTAGVVLGAVAIVGAVAVLGLMLDSWRRRMEARVDRVDDGGGGGGRAGAGPPVGA